MRDITVKLIICSIVLSGVFLLSSSNAGAQSTESISFFLDSNFDKLSRTKATATLRFEAEKVQYYVEDDYWNSLSATQRANALNNLDAVADTFDSQIYPRVTDVFGTEWNPGIDNNPKVTVLAVRMRDNLAGYFREEDEFPRSQFTTSNEREMLYASTNLLAGTRQFEALLAHELQHLINFNQNRRLKNIKEEIWLNELMSEAAPSIAGLNNDYSGSSLQSRINVFLKSPADALTRWNNQEQDYGAVSALGHFLLGHFGDEFYTALMDSTNTGIEAIDDALLAVGSESTFKDVFNSWVVANLANNCKISPFNTFCYMNPDLNYNNLHIEFETGTDGGKRVAKAEKTFPWQGNWFSYSRDIEAEKPDDHVFVFTTDKPNGYNFLVPYVVYPKTGLPEVFYSTFEGNRARFYIEDFGYNVDEVVVMPIFELTGTTNTPLVDYSLVAEITETIPSDDTESIPAADGSPLSLSLPEGAVARAEGSDKVYIIKGQYKRWVQTAELFNMYGHLEWEDIITVAPGVLDAYTESTVVSVAGDERVFFVSLNGQKRWIETEDELIDLGFSFDMVYTINEKELNYYETI